MGTLQLQLNLEPSHFRALNLVGMVRACMIESEWVTPWEVQRTIHQITGEIHSDSSITARMRDLRKAEYGGYLIERRKREGTKSFEYRMMREF